MVHAGGRPTEYNNEILTKANEYIISCEDEEEQQLTGLSVKGTELYKNKLKVNIPTIEGLAIYLDISRDTIYDWEKVYPEFSYIIGQLRAKQANALISKGLSGDYNPTIAKVLLTKHGYREGIEQTGKDGGAIEVASEDIKDLATQLNALHRTTSIGGDGVVSSPMGEEVQD